MKTNILAFAVHPDDAELGCSGTLMRHIAAGQTVGIIDLTRGELGTRGSAALRDVEAKRAAEIMGVSIRENLGMADGFFQNDREHQLSVIKMIRKYRPDIVLANAIYDRHPDHSRSSSLVADAYFYSGLQKIETSLDGRTQEAWRPRALYHYIQDRHIAPDFVVDITDFIEKKMQAIKAFSSQFHDPDSTEIETYISSPEFMEGITSRAREFGRPVGYHYAEGFTCARTPGINLLNLLD